MRKLALLATTAAFVGLSAVAQAAPVPIIAFGQADLTMTGVTAAAFGGLTTTVTATNTEIIVTAYNDGVATPFAAFLNINASSTGAAFLVAATDDVVQPFAGSFSITSAMGGGGINYLSGTFADIALAGSRLSGPEGGFQAGLTASQPPGIVNLTSSVIPASQLADPSSIGFTFTGLTPAGLDICGSTICGFSGVVSGNASASQVAVPVPGSLALLGVGLFGLAALRRKVPA